MTTRLAHRGLAAILVLLVGMAPAAAQTWTADNGNGTFSNPLFYDEFSDCDLIRVGADFYLTGTTMHSMPGLPILQSRDLVNWRFLGYAFDTLDLGPAFRLEDGKHVYGQGIWAPSFRHHKGTFHIFSNVNGQTTQLFRATSPAGPWTRTPMKRSFHDLSVLFDDDGKAYVVWGYRGIRLAELTPDLLDVVPGTEREIIPPGAGMGEGLHLYKIRGKYILTSAWFLGEMRMPTARADRLAGPWEVNQGVSRGEDFGFAEGNRLAQRPPGSPPPPPFTVRAGDAEALGRNAIHQGGIVDTPTGEWWGFSMMDANSVGRLTALSPVTWADGWPYFGLPKNLGRSPRTWVKPRTGAPSSPPVSPYRRSDDFSAARLQPIWQWNHVPVAGQWSLTERPGHLRLRTLAATDLLTARNTLTQRAIGPRSTPTVILDAAGLKPGDTAGLALFTARTPGSERASMPKGRRSSTRPKKAAWSRACRSRPGGSGCAPPATSSARKPASATAPTARIFQPIGDPFRLVFQLMTFQGVRYSLFAFGGGGGFADFDAIDVREPDPRGLTIPIPYGRAIELAAQGQALGPPSRRWLADADHALQIGAGPGTRFTVLDRGLGRVALRSERGLVSVGADGTLTLRDGAPGEAETFQWIETFTGELTLLSLATQRYVRLETTADGGAGTLRADAPGPHPNRRDGVRWTWTGPADLAVPRPDANSKLAHEQLLDKAKQGRTDVYFVGDSITRRWGATDYPDFLAHWKASFSGWNAGDFGWGADSTQHILWRLGHGELDGVDPKVIVILAGTNNVGSVPASPERRAGKIADVTAGLKAIVDLCRTKAPRATIVLTAIFPRNDNMAVMPEIDAINANLARLADGRSVRFLNVNDTLADAQGTLFEGMAGDKLHPTLKGYQVWADGLKPILTELLGPPAATDLGPPPTGDPSARPRPVPPVVPPAVP